MGESTSLKEILSTLTKRILLIMIVTAVPLAPADSLVSSHLHPSMKIQLRFWSTNRKMNEKKFNLTMSKPIFS